MTVPFSKGRYSVRLADGPEDVLAAQQLRHRCFYDCDGVDDDGYDAGRVHILVFDGKGLVGTCRVGLFPDAADILQSYAAERYDLTRLARYATGAMELGRVCVRPDAGEHDILRLIWGVLARMVDQNGVGLIFGCASFKGINAADHAEALSYLAGRHGAPARWAPGIASPDTVPLSVTQGSPSRAGLPPLLRSYLAMGGWVSDHAVIDRDLMTLHVLTVVEVSQIPPRRAAALRAIID